MLFYGITVSIEQASAHTLVAYIYAHREQLEERGQGHLPDQLVSELEQAWGVEFEEGHNKDLDFMVRCCLLFWGSFGSCLTLFDVDL